jgi:hypothetical protein
MLSSPENLPFDHSSTPEPLRHSPLLSSIGEDPLSTPRCLYSLQTDFAGDDRFAFDDDMNDDLLIAEANDQALENDDEEFYGLEFGFFARAYCDNTEW